MTQESGRVPVQNLPASVPDDETRPLRTVVLEHADLCFRDTDGITRDAARMLEIMDTWQPNRSDAEAGVWRNTAFDPQLRVVVVADAQICYPDSAEHLGQPSLLFTIVSRDAV